MEAAAQAVAEPKKEAKKVPMAMPEQFGLAEYKRRDWVMDVEPHLKVEDILEPIYWSHVSEGMAPMDKIEARWQDGTQVIHLRVRKCGHAYADVVVVGTEKLGAIDEEVLDVLTKHKIVWRAAHKHSVVRTSDNEVIKDGFDDKASATAWALKLERSN